MASNKEKGNSSKKSTKHETNKWDSNSQEPCFHATHKKWLILAALYDHYWIKKANTDFVLSCDYVVCLYCRLCDNNVYYKFSEILDITNNVTGQICRRFKLESTIDADDARGYVIVSASDKQIPNKWIEKAKQELSSTIPST